jgi:hypothetical protein
MKARDQLTERSDFGCTDGIARKECGKFVLCGELMNGGAFFY